MSTQHPFTYAQLLAIRDGLELLQPEGNAVSIVSTAQSKINVLIRESLEPQLDREAEWQELLRLRGLMPSPDRDQAKYDIEQNIPAMTRQAANYLANIFTTGFVESGGLLGTTYDDNPDSIRSVAYDSGRALGNRFADLANTAPRQTTLHIPLSTLERYVTEALVPYEQRGELGKWKVTSVELENDELNVVVVDE